MYIFRYSYEGAWNNTCIKYAEELTTENVQKFLLSLPPFKENWSTEYETKFMDQIGLYQVEDPEFVLETYGEEGNLFLKIEDEHCDNHWCFFKKIEHV
jgi:hypothetical protein